MTFLSDLKAARLQATKTREALDADNDMTKLDWFVRLNAVERADRAVSALLVNKVEAIEQALWDAKEGGVTHWRLRGESGPCGWNCRGCSFESQMAALDGPTEKI